MSKKITPTPSGEDLLQELHNELYLAQRTENIETLMGSVGKARLLLARYRESLPIDFKQATDQGGWQPIATAIDALEILNRRPRPMCRDCADENGTCPGSGLPCDMSTVIRNARNALASPTLQGVADGDAT